MRLKIACGTESEKVEKLVFTLLFLTYQFVFSYPSDATNSEEMIQ